MHSLSAAVCSKHFCTKSSFLLLASSTHFSHSTNCRLHDPPFMYAQKPHVSSSSSSFSFTSSSSSSSSFDCCVPVMMEFLSLSLSLSFGVEYKKSQTRPPPPLVVVVPSNERCAPARCTTSPPLSRASARVLARKRNDDARQRDTKHF